MITCKLNGKTYSIDFISGRALREIGEANAAYQKIMAETNAALAGEAPPEEKPISIDNALDALVKWFCLVFRNQFTPDDVYDGYPADRLVHDVTMTMMAVQAQMTEVLDAFPTTAARETAREET